MPNLAVLTVLNSYICVCAGWSDKVHYTAFSVGCLHEKKYCTYIESKLALTLEGNFQSLLLLHEQVYCVNHKILYSQSCLMGHYLFRQAI